MSKKRIFWLGMHKILVKTELPRLRQLGYEVFNPPYLSSIEDQSANMEWDQGQVSTLPGDIFEKISSYNFFYNEINEEIADILNTYFDVIVVTILPRWLASVLRVYSGKVVFRTYGQHYKLCDELRREGVLNNISLRENFTFMPHAEESLVGEQSWLRERAVVVPYCLGPDIFDHAGQWRRSSSTSSDEIAISCPNIANDFFREHYNFLKKNFSEEHYKFFGVQLKSIDDPQVVGTLRYEELLQRYRNVKGYLYTYTDARVCYLPPIEMMVVGAPVLYLKGSLLARYFPEDAPGICETIEEAKNKVARLLRNDNNFIESLQKSQESVVKRYHPDFVWPIFDKTFSRILDESIPAHGWLTKEPQNWTSGVRRIYLLHHFPGQPISFDGEEYSANEGIPRVMRQVVLALSKCENVEVLVTARHDQAEYFYGFFAAHLPKGHTVKVLMIDDEPAASSGRYSKFTQFKEFIRRNVPQRYRPYLRGGLQSLRRVKSYARHVFSSEHNEKQGRGIPRYIQQINSDDSCYGVIVPHYYWFPEALNANRDVYLYLPDYMPHFFHETGEFVEDEGTPARIGQKLVEKSKIVFCNSEFTKGYLPQSRLKVEKGKIRVFYLPLLNSVKKVNYNQKLPFSLKKGDYVFYPTQPRPNKNLSFLLKVFDSLVERGNSLKLVLTSDLSPDPKAMAAYKSMKFPQDVIFLSSISDEALGRLYSQAALLCFTSLAEGNFPPQIQEALIYRTPVVASRLGFITERISEDMNDPLMLCEANNLDEYVSACEFALKNRELILERQEKLREKFYRIDEQAVQQGIKSILFDEE